MWGERKKLTIRFPYNEYILTQGFKNVVVLSKICSQLHPLCEFDTLGEWLCKRIVRVIVYTWLQILWWMLHSVIPMQSLALCNVVFYGRSKMSGSGSMQTKPVPAPWRGRKLKELSTSDNCRMCGLFQNTVQFWEWVDKLWKYVCCPYYKRWNITRVGQPSEKQTFHFPRWRRIFVHESLLAMWNKGLKLRCAAFAN